MTTQQLAVRKRRAQEAPLVIQQTEQGFLVYSAANPGTVYHVTNGSGRLGCTCPDFKTHRADPTWQCKHILAVLEKHGHSAGSSAEDELTEERAAIQAESIALAPPKPAKERRRRTNGNGAAQMLIKRSVSPDGRINAVSVEFITSVDGAPVSEIKARAVRTLKLQNEITQSFLKLNEHATPDGAESDTTGAAPLQEQPNGQAVPARLLDGGSSTGRFGPRLFISVSTNGKRLRLYGSPRQLAAYIGYAGQQIAPEELEAGLRLNMPCRVVLTENDNGYLTVSKVFRAGLQAQRGRTSWQQQRS